MKICHHCHENKELLDFNKCKTGMQGLHNHCRTCQKIIKRKWYESNREKELEKSKLYGKTEECRLAAKKRYDANPKFFNQKNNIRRKLEPAKIKARLQRKKWREIPQNRIACSCRSRIRGALRGISKVKHTEELTCCSFEQLRDHLAAQFKEGMSWQNYGEWHIDHILPCASFDLTKADEQLKCFHYSNLQPLWSKENISKGSRVLSID